MRVRDLSRTGATLLDNFIPVSAPSGPEPAVRDRLRDRPTEDVGAPEVTAPFTKRLPMAPGSVRGPELGAALAVQKQAFARLRAEN